MAYTRELVYKQWLAELKEDLVKEYNALGLRASGKYEKELEEKIEGNKVIMLGAYHSQFMELGRRAGGMPPIAAIMQWIDDKRIAIPTGMAKKSLAFAIATKIKKQGIKVPNKYNAGGVLSKVITDERIKKLIQQLQFVEVENIVSDVMNLIKAA